MKINKIIFNLNSKINPIINRDEQYIDIQGSSDSLREDILTELSSELEEKGYEVQLSPGGIKCKELIDDDVYKDISNIVKTFISNYLG